MIIFTPFHQTKEVLMQVRPDSYNFYEFNLSNPMNYGVSLSALIPSPEYIPQEVITGSMDTPDFDIAYSNFVLGQQEQFYSFMNIVLPLYNDPCACVIVYIQASPIRDIILECLMKLIQQRYGYHPFMINELYDISYINDSSSFSPRGILNIQEDSDRALIEGYYGKIVIPEE